VACACFWQTEIIAGNVVVRRPVAIACVDLKPVGEEKGFYCQMFQENHATAWISREFQEPGAAVIHPGTNVLHYARHLRASILHTFHPGVPGRFCDQRMAHAQRQRHPWHPAEAVREL
jgi:hypothetical protein